ncbi:MAG TPA: hypothetical protein VII45_13785 [Solirubrobacterales bacterium]
MTNVVAAADAASRATAKGRTGQGYRIKLAMQGADSFRIVGFKADLECRDGTELQLEEGGFLSTLVRPNGSFHEMQYGDTDRVYIQGRVKGSSVRGRLRLTDRYGKGNPCKSRWINFHAG